METVILTVVSCLIAVLILVGENRHIRGIVLRIFEGRERTRRLERENRRLREALRLYAAPENWIGDAFVRTPDPTLPANYGLGGMSVEQIKALPPKYPEV